MNYKHLAVTGAIPDKVVVDQRDLAYKMDAMKRDNLLELLELVINESLGVQEVEYDTVRKQYIVRTHIYVGDPNAKV